MNRLPCCISQYLIRNHPEEKDVSGYRSGYFWTRWGLGYSMETSSMDNALHFVSPFLKCQPTLLWANQSRRAVEVLRQISALYVCTPC